VKRRFRLVGILAADPAKNFVAIKDGKVYKNAIK
jgi:hypothetical protein